MTDKILGTFFTRIAATLMMLIVVIINTNVFGAAGTGTIALVILGLTLLQVLSNFVGGSTLVYLVPQKNNFQLLFLSYAWSLISNIVGLVLLRVFHLIPPEYTLLLLVLTLIYSIYYIHTSLMQGKEDIKIFNLYQLSQAVLLLLFLGALLLYAHLSHIKPTIDYYLYAYLGSYAIPTIASCFYTAKHIEHPTFSGMGTLLKEMFKLGFWTQLANLTQLLTYRLNYYLIEAYAGRKPLGIFELGTKISEAVWIFPKSICLVQYARLSNNHEDKYAKQLTMSLLKIVLIFALFAVLILLLLPGKFIAFIFGPEFVNSKPVICSLAPGIVFLSCMTILAHHFSGYGKYWINALSSLIGLIITAVAGITLLPAAAKVSTEFALQTAGWITSCAYLASLLFTLIMFFKHTKVCWHDFLITKTDWQLFKNIIQEKMASLHKKDKK